jgi:hypothetical protein
MKPEHKQLIDSFSAYLEQHPDERWSQALTNWMGVSYLCITSSPVGQDMFHVQDEDLLNVVEK